MLPNRIAWRRRFDAESPSSEIHQSSTPPLLEILSLLPVAYRVGSYIYGERKAGREPIFDLNGLQLQPPNPGPYAGVPLGGIGSGSIGRGFRGEFRRWSLHPGRYIHEVVEADCFSIRVKRGDRIYSKVLSLDLPHNNSSTTSSWPHVHAASGTYHALFPLSWSVFEEPVPGIRVIIRQLSPFLPHDNAESSLPCGIFDIEVEDILQGQQEKSQEQQDIEVSVMFVFQNGLNSDTETRSSSDFQFESFDVSRSSSLAASNESIFGVNMSYQSTMKLAAVSSSSQQSHNQDGDQEEKEQASLFQCSINTDTVNNTTTIGDVNSFSIAAVKDSDDTTISSCRRFLTFKGKHPTSSSCFASPTFDDDIEDEFDDAARLWEEFEKTGQVTDFTRSHSSASTSLPGSRYSSALCVTKAMQCGKKVQFSFSLAWDHPVARFGSGFGLPRYYTRFLRNSLNLHSSSAMLQLSGKNAGLIAAYALQRRHIWYDKITSWQQEVMTKIDAKLACNQDTRREESQFYYGQLFNELYFLVDGGTLWLDSHEGVSNNSQPLLVPQQQQHMPPATARKSSKIVGKHSEGSLDGDRGLMLREQELHVSLLDDNSDVSPGGSNAKHKSISQHTLTHLYKAMEEHNLLATASCVGDQHIIGQFLYLEGHEYLMYNTYDVHFYAGNSLLMLWPQLELSLQHDTLLAVSQEDPQLRVMMGEGTIRPRKVMNVVAHDLGSPSEHPFIRVNAYNFQDVSHWKDLTPKCILQICRNHCYLIKTGKLNAGMLLTYLGRWFPTLVAIMEHCLAEHDQDHDGMIENGGYPDQTYDIWTAKGVHAYCGGLWIAACEGLAYIASLLNENAVHVRFQDIAKQARIVYVSSLWNGSYLNYDSSTSGHHDSIMADMLAGHWYSKACGLPDLISSEQVMSCLNVIYKQNVLAFGRGQFVGAVNGMRPGGGSGGSGGDVDSCCIQSREVWTGTTYALAATMLQEAYLCPNRSVEEKEKLLKMAFNTARGIHDAGWQRFGYWFATPEGWERNGNYRSLGYMRPLAIWAMQYALEMSEGQD